MEAIQVVLCHYCLYALRYDDTSAFDNDDHITAFKHIYSIGSIAQCKTEQHFKCECCKNTIPCDHQYIVDAEEIKQ
jgi:hypothetical protein